MESWVPPAGLPDCVITPIRAAIEKIPSTHFPPPQAGEVLNPDEAYERLQNYAFTQGFCIVISSRDKANTFVRFVCIHHGYNTRNWRKLDDHKTMESNRQKEYTSICARGCPWQVYTSYRGVTRGAEQKAWFLGITNGSHADTHDMVPNPLAYSVHARRQPQYAEAVQQAIALRASQITYGQASRILEAQHLSIDRRAFYNSQRGLDQSQEGADLQSLFGYLSGKGYHCHSRYKYDMDSATAEPINRYLEMFFFMSDTQIQWTQRFCSSFMIEIDITFNTNNLRLPLIILTGITNTGASFPAAFCFVPSESKASFDFVFEKLKEIVWEEYPPPRVVVGDQAKGLSASLPSSMGGTQGQFCEWHAFENIRKRLLDSGYEREKLNIIKPLIWSYLQADTLDALTTARAALLKPLNIVDIKYIKENWVSKESFVCRGLTKMLPNLGVNSTQRAESMNAVLKKTLSRQITVLEVLRECLGAFRSGVMGRSGQCSADVIGTKQCPRGHSHEVMAPCDGAMASTLSAESHPPS